MMPMPPCCASPIARCDSVTVSIAALTMGIFSSIRLVRRVVVRTSVGRMSDFNGTIKTSSYVYASSKSRFSLKLPLHDISYTFCHCRRDRDHCGQPLAHHVSPDGGHPPRHHHQPD